MWDVIRRHDNPKTGDGCFATVAQLAAEIGRHPRTVERFIGDLVRWRLVWAERRGTRMHRFARLPEQCYPSERPTAAELRRFTVLLDAWVERQSPADVADRERS